MGMKRALLYLFLSAVMIVSFQNCGQSGAIGLEVQELNKVSDNNGGNGLIDISDVQDPNQDADDDQTVPGTKEPSVPVVKDPVPPVVKDPTVPPVVQPPVVKDPAIPPVVLPPVVGNPPKPVDPPIKVPTPGKDPEDDGYGDDIVDSDDEGNIIGRRVHCDELLKLSIPMIGNASDNSTYNHTRGFLIINNKEQISVDNHRGPLIIRNVKNASLNNIRSLFLSAQIGALSNLSDVRALSLISTNSIGSVNKYRGLSCLSGAVGDVDNFRGVLEVKGNVESVKNFRGILKVDGNVGEIDNFRGVLIVSGSVGSKKNVKVRAP
jgi:hypothetical protein